MLLVACSTNVLADAVKAGDPAAAQAAFAKGAALDLHYVKRMREQDEQCGGDRIPGDAAWLTADDLLGRISSDSRRYPSLEVNGVGMTGCEEDNDVLSLICFVADYIPIDGVRSNDASCESRSCADSASQRARFCLAICVRW